MEQNINVDLSTAQDIVCTACGNYSFEQVVLMTKISALVSPNGREGIVPIPVFACNACGFINQEFLPTAMRGVGEEEEVPENTERPKLELVRE